MNTCIERWTIGYKPTGFLWALVGYVQGVMAYLSGITQSIRMIIDLSVFVSIMTRIYSYGCTI